MVLLINGCSWHLKKSDIVGLHLFKTEGVDELLQLPDLRASAEEFRRTGVISISSESEILYVHQNEYATVCFPRTDFPLTSNSKYLRPHPYLPRFVGTSQMTSCHAVLVVSADAFVFGHLDGSGEGKLTREFFRSVIDFLSTRGPDQEPPKVHIVGGFSDPHGHSRVVLTQILTELALSEVSFSLKTFCAYTLNESKCANKGSFLQPVVRDVVYDIWSNKLFPAKIALEATGPLGVLRSSYTWSKKASRTMNSIFDPHTYRITIRPFSFNPLTLVEARKFAHLPREQLEHFSTTPKQESEDFYTMLRALGQLLTNMSAEPEIFRKGLLIFSYDTLTNSWKPLDDASVEASKNLWATYGLTPRL
uniref:Protein N-terminal asparagine amidohydrolase n=2 Tax=Schistocephalus solidus TaxID=70667 RepID=A0A0X3PL72_SCHSO